ncbi:MAG TPA: Fic family protein [Burkholderiales bacterium]|nr:Fic family protein [Burkholderiales bacterium]
MAKRHISKAIVDYLADRAVTGQGPVGAEDITAHVGAPRPTVNRYLAKLVAAGDIVREGTGPATVYRPPKPVAAPTVSVTETMRAADSVRATASPKWSAEALALRAQFTAPLGTRAPTTYQRKIVDDYRPNESSLLPPKLAEALFAEGRMRGQQPAGTYARKVLEQLLIDLSWHSSRLEGNRKSLLDTRELFAKGRSPGDDADATMLLNHKDAIEFIVDAVPTYGITVPVVRNIHSLLMQGLLANSEALGAIRKTVVNISDTVYVPTQVPTLLEEMLGHAVEKARNVKNPVEAAFFLWVNLAYLQPFEDGNKRTSRLCANLPLLLANCAPLSFLDVEPTDYAMAMLGVYERLELTLAKELFAWTYRRSIPKYRTIIESMGAPNPFRAKYREHVGEAVRQIVAAGAPLADAIATLGITAEDQAPFADLLREELQLLEPYNCARYRLAIGTAEKWIENGRPIR